MMYPQRGKRIFLLSCIAVLCLWASSAFAQGYGTISGTVTDPSGAFVASATVKVTQAQTGREITAVSNKDGAFVFPALLPSGYSLSVTAKGFQAYTQTGIVLQATQALTVAVKLQVGSAKDTVEVTSEVPQVDTTTGTLSQVIDERRVVDIPLNGRNAASLITLVAGVADATNEGNGVNQGKGKSFPSVVVSTANGTLPNQSNYLLNGGNNVDEMTNANAPFPMPDAVQEFSVQTSNYNAEYGQSAGAMVNIVTKSGTRSFHGDAFEFLRNGYFNAKPYFANSADTMHRNQWGGTIGGPVIIPHVSKGNTTQFFFGYQKTTIHQASSANTTTVPTLAEEGRDSSGNFTLPYADLGQWCTGTQPVNGAALPIGFDGTGTCRVQGADNRVADNQIKNAWTGALYPYNRIPTSDFDPVSKNLMKAFPSYSGAEAAGKLGGAVNYTKPSVEDLHEEIARLDHQFSSKDQLFGHYFHDYYESPAVYDPNMLASYTSYFNTRYQNALLAETHIFSNSLVNNLTVNYQRMVALRGGPAGSPDITAFGVQNLWQPDNGPYMEFTVSNYFQTKSSAFAGWMRNNYTMNDDLHWVKGNHNIAFGVHYELSKFDVNNVYQSYGGFGFGTLSGPGYNNGFANFLQGFMTSFNQGNYTLVNDRNHFPGAYAQDSWKVNRRLTLNYGVRWEMFAPWHNKVGYLQQFSPTAYANNQSTSAYTTLPAGLLLSGVDGVPENGAENQYKKFMPRFGFAYDVKGDGKTVVRGGWGMFYQDRLPGFFNINQAGMAPNTMSVSLSNLGMGGTNSGGPFSNPYCVGGCNGKGVLYNNPFPFTLPFGSSQKFPTQMQVLQYDPNFKVPVTYSYNLIIERQLTGSMAARIAYVGSGSRHQFVNLELNPAVNNGVAALAKNTNARRVYNTAPTIGPCTTTTGCAMSYTNMIDAAMIGSAKYNSFQATLDKKMSHGLYFMANVTWSKTYDDMPQATRVSNTENLNAGASYVYPLYPTNATGIPAAAYVKDIKALDRGLSDIDHPLVFSLSYNWQLPKLHSGNGILQAVANGWNMSGIVSHRSGDSLTSYAVTDVSLTGLGQDRMVYDSSKAMYYSDTTGVADNCKATAHCVQWLNPAAFSMPVNTGAGTGFGNVVKGSQRGPGYSNWDASITRSFHIYRETSLQFRAEYFNVLNHTELKNPDLAGNSATFGAVKSAYDPRIAQFALKYVF